MSPFAMLRLKLGTLGWYSDSARKKKLWFLMAMFLILPMLFIQAEIDNDLWFMLNHGRYILTHGFSSIEPFTVHEGLTFSFEKWLACVIFWKIYSIGGAKAIYVFVVAVGAAITAVFYKLCMLVSDKNHVVSCFVTGFTLLSCFTAFMVSRPQIFGYLFMMIELFLLEKYVREGSWKYLIPLPFISILWMQLHSTMWIICFIVMLPYLCECKWFNGIRGLTAQSYKKKPLLITMALMFGGGFINPYGAHSVFYLLESLKNSKLMNVGISELQKTSINYITIFAFVIAANILFFWFKRRKVPVRYALLCAGTFLMGLYAVRNMAFFTLAGGAVVAWEFKDIEIPNKWTKHGLDILVIGIPCIALYAILSTVSPNADIGYFDDLYSRTSCKEAVDYLAKETNRQDDIRLFTTFNDGAYAEFKGFKCYIDPRAEVFIKDVNKKADIMDEYAELNANKITYQEIQDKYDFDYWLADKGDGYALYMQYDSAYENIYEDDYCIIFKVDKDKTSDLAAKLKEQKKQQQQDAKTYTDKDTEVGKQNKIRNKSNWEAKNMTENKKEK